MIDSKVRGVRASETVVGIMMLALSLMRNIAISALPASREPVFFKSRVGKVKFWPVLIVTLLGVLVYIPQVHGTPTELNNTTLDFETGDLRGWDIYKGYYGTNLSTAFDNQPTLGDNPTARNRGQPSNHQGNYWIGTYENYQGLPDQTPGDIQGDEPVGDIASPYFTIPSGTLSFLIGGGSSFETRVELVTPVDCGIESCPDKTLLYASGQNTETMSRVTWDLNPYAGKTGRIRIVDASSGGWGHINVDDFVFQPVPPPNISIVSPSNGQSFTISTITVSGTASGNVDLKTVEVKVNSGSWQLASGTTSWRIQVTLSSNMNTIRARTTDTFGNTAETLVVVNYTTTLPAYTVSVSTSPSGLNPHPAGGGTYDNGTSATVTAQTVTGYTFQGWTENGKTINTSTSYTFTVYGNRSLVAEYSRNQYNISVLISPSGLDPQPTGGGTYSYNDTAKVIAQPATGYTFQRWTENGNPVSTDASYSFNVTGNRTLMAEYSKNAYTVSVSTSPVGLDSQPAGGGNYSFGDAVTVTAQPVTDYTFQRWTENGNQVSTDLRYSFKSTRNRNLVAEYSKAAGPTITIGPSPDVKGTEMTPGETKNSSVPVGFEIELKPPVLGLIIAIFAIIAAAGILKYLVVGASKLKVDIEKLLQMNIETSGGESLNKPESSRQYKVNVDVKGGIKRL